MSEALYTTNTMRKAKPGWYWYRFTNDKVKPEIMQIRPSRRGEDYVCLDFPYPSACSMHYEKLKQQYPTLIIWGPLAVPGL